ncbi:MAG: MgtC/SapB family protein [Bacillota bacterium]
MGPVELAIRLILASVLGAVVGLEREAHNRPAGLRTHTLVSLGSALIMLVSVYGFNEQIMAGRSSDPGRIAAQVVSGIGFLGAGTILRQGSTVKGLTTAASLWVVAGIGLAVGTGYYWGAIATTGLVMFSLTLFDKIGGRFNERREHVLVVRGLDAPGILGRVGTVLGDFNVNIRSVELENADNGELIIRLTVRTPNHLNVDELSRILVSTKDVTNVEWEGRTSSYGL